MYLDHALNNATHRRSVFRWLMIWCVMLSFQCPLARAADSHQVQATEPMVVPRQGHTATRLSTGNVLLAGGDADGTAELFNPADGSFTPTAAPLNVARSGHSATLFSDNNVFMAGGGTKSNEFFQASDSTFVLWPFALNEIRVGHSAIPGSDGKLLVIGGDPTGTLEQFDPATGSAPTLLLPSPSSTASL